MLGYSTNSTLPINLTKAIASEIGHHMGNKRHTTPKVIALKSLGFWGEKQNNPI